MKLLIYLGSAFMMIIGMVTGQNHLWLANNNDEETTVEQPVTDFDRAVDIIKKYEGLHQPKHWPLIGYGHKVLPGEKYSRSKALGQEQAEELLRKDLLKNCAVFRSFGADSLILGVLAYNIGSGNVLRSSVAKKLKEGDRDIFENYVAHSKYRGKTLNQLKKRRIEEYESLFIKEIKNPDKEDAQFKEAEHSIIIDEHA